MARKVGVKIINEYHLKQIQFSFLSIYLNCFCDSSPNVSNYSFQVQFGPHYCFN